MFKQILFFLLILFINCLHPLQKTLALIIFVIFIILDLAKFSSHWVCYLFALIYFGGVLILFTYISSVVPNFAPNSIIILPCFALGLILSFFRPQNSWSVQETFQTTELPLSFIYSSSSVFILLFILSIVVILLLLRVRILRDFKSPLRNI